MHTVALGIIGFDYTWDSLCPVKSVGLDVLIRSENGLMAKFLCSMMRLNMRYVSNPGLHPFMTTNLYVRCGTKQSKPAWSSLWTFGIQTFLKRRYNFCKLLLPTETNRQLNVAIISFNEPWNHTKAAPTQAFSMRYKLNKLPAWHAVKTCVGHGIAHFAPRAGMTSTRSNICWVYLI